MSNNREKNLWKEMDRLAFWASIAAIVILTVIYFAIGRMKPDEESIWSTACVFVLDIIANLIPVLLLFMGSYALLRRIQAFRTEQETEELASKIASKVAGLLRTGHPANVAQGELIIESAMYGAEDKTDVTQLLRSKVSSGRLEIRVCNDDLGGDPSPGAVKELEVVYFYAGHKYSIIVSEGGILSLP